MAAASVVALLGPGAAPPPGPESVEAATLPSGFVETTVFSGLTNPSVIRFASDGRVFVAEKSGLIKVFDNTLDTTPTTFADLRTNVHNFWDRGLLGMALHPSFPAEPYVYVIYTYDHILGDTAPAPRWGSPGATSDGCPSPPGATGDGCVVSGRLSRLQAAGNVMTGPEQVLVDDWCQQYPSHATGTVDFGPDGALYASAGDGASFNFVDYGQDGSPLNPCGDPPGPPGTTLTPPTAQGGALRSQDLRTTADPTSLDGSIIRVDPATGAGLPSNPNAGSSDPNARRIIAYGLRNPFRFAFRPGASDLWVGDVGWNDWEEINRIPNPSDSVVENFGWPCYEGSSRQGGYDAVNLSICETLYSQSGADTKPFFAYRHADTVVTGESCPTGSSSVAGIAFEFATQTSYPADFQGALFFADYSRDCIWVMKRNGGALPSTGAISTFVAGAANPVHLEFGPDGNLYYADFDGGTIRKIAPGTTPPSSGEYLSDLTWTTMTNGWGPVEEDLSNGEASAGDGAPITLNGTAYAKGLGAHAASDVRYPLGPTCTRFKASVGVDDEVGGNGSVTFEVYAGATKVYDSGAMTGLSATKLVDVSIAGASELRLVVAPGAANAFDHGDWALARIECGGGGTDTTPPTIEQMTPAAGATAVATNVAPTATFSETMNATTLNATTFTLVKQGTSTPVAASVFYDSQTATLTPSANLEPLTTYTATVKGGATGAKDVAGNPLPADVSWSFQTASAPSPTTYLSDLTWTTMTNGWGPVEEDLSNGEASAGDGAPITLNGTAYAKGLGAHAASDVRYPLGPTCTRFKASVGVDDEVGGNGSVTFEVYAGATKVYDSGAMTGLSATKLVDVSIAGASELRLVVAPGAANAFDHGDWALARIECGGGGTDTTPPTISTRTPTPGATGVAIAVSPTATFSEAMDPATLTTTTFTLVKQGLTTPIAAAVSYANQTVTLDPSANLEQQTTYTVTVKGGVTGARDIAGNALASDSTWTFTTAAGTNAPPTPVIDTPPTGLTWKVGDTIAFTGHATDPEQGTLPATALSWKLLIQHCPSNCHTHTVQTWDDVAGASFPAPDHEYPAYLDLELTATDAQGASTAITRRLDPQTVVLTFSSNPSGLALAVNATSATTPFTRTVIVGSQNSITATSPQVQGSTTYDFASWSDSGAQTHNITAPATATTFTATYAPATGGGTSAFLSDLTWTSMNNAWGPVEEDLSNGEASAGDGAPITLNGTAYAKGLGAHAASDVRYPLGPTCTRFKASVGVDDEVGGNGSVTFEVYAGATKVYDSGAMTGLSATKLVDVSIAGASELRLVVAPGAANAFDHGDWALARIECGGGGTDTTPPTIEQMTPAAGATAVATNVAPTATFSETMNATTLNATTFTLVKQGTSTPVAASVFYDSQTATLTPSANLEPLTTYTATVKGGATGAKDVAGNPLPADVSWSFQTASAPSPTTYLSDLTWTTMTNGWGPVEEDLSNGEASAGDGAPITLNGTAYAKGLGAHAASDVRYPLGPTCTRFKASVGVDDEVGGNGSVTFEVYAGATKVYDSGAMTGLSATKLVDVSIAGASELRLVVAPGAANAFDHGDWALARIEC